ncbi:FeoB-associated Cys-rich membrane protein [Hymenobacter cellulosilyticus]|uniref:FeoB-associated Cys-rich membrane protein n=1 Tax=Hymenobacter cellulosilyticus TaxID=2932248 RepID=A0A8T9QA79_9BACT|nr:FeoB-associated Cys-rich membrane protein [Hymenobacter cellulosilyticus]UOQ73311.1 FeoB-associated Cys-rich membrane protein [Hymenobacter cellulosilyticus]
MILQYTIIVLLFLAATFYVGRIFWRAFFVKTASGCAKGCGGACSTIDVDRLQRTIETAAARAAAK